MFQHRAERFSNNRERNTSSVCDILQHLNWCSFEDKHRNALLVMMYKIANENVVITKKDRLKPPLRQSGNMHSSSVIFLPCKTYQRQE